VSPAHPVVWAGETVQLLGERALWWPAERCLLLADLHLGKAASFRAAGQPVPVGTTQRNLARLDGLLHTLGADQLVVLGDFLHARAAQTPTLLEQLAQWRARHARLAITLVRGNHDSHAGDPPAALGITIVDEPHLLGPFACCHHPQAHATHFVLAGHVHPVCSLHGPARDRLRLPCFVAEPQQALLPAFGEFTGGWRVERLPGRRLYAVAGGQVWPLP
jgi:DNA ligase-associated metallophosphoesterase